MPEKTQHGGPREGAGRPPTERDDKAVKLDRDLADKAAIIAKHRGITIAELLSEITEEYIEREYAKILHEIDNRAKQKRGRKGKS